MDSSISYEKSSNSLHSFLQQHHQQQQQQQQHQHQQLRLSVQQHHQQQQQQHLVDNSDKLNSDQSDQENQQQTDSCLFSRLQNCSSDQNGQLDTSQLAPFIACTNPHGIDTILNRRGLVSMAGGSAGNTCTVADTLAAAALQQSAISRYRTHPTKQTLVRLVNSIFTYTRVILLSVSFDHFLSTVVKRIDFKIITDLTKIWPKMFNL